MKVRIKTTPYGRYFFGTINWKNLRGAGRRFQTLFCLSLPESLQGIKLRVLMYGSYIHFLAESVLKTYTEKGMPLFVWLLHSFSGLK